jgi:hypothetical protein
LPGCVGWWLHERAELTLRGSPSLIEKLELENAALREQVQTLRNRLGEVQGVDVPICLSFPAIDAHVLEVSRDSKLVVLDRGEQAGVEVGYVFDVYLGSRYKGRVRITTVQASTSSGLILSEKNPIAAGDNATTVL